MLVITSDRGLCGAYNANAIRTAEQLISRLNEEGKQVALYVVGRKGVTYYRFRKRPIETSWTGFSEQPTYADARDVAHTLIQAFVAGADDADGVGADGQPIAQPGSTECSAWTSCTSCTPSSDR